jgi:hypothetical protein
MKIWTSLELLASLMPLYEWVMKARGKDALKFGVHSVQMHSLWFVIHHCIRYVYCGYIYLFLIQLMNCLGCTTEVWFPAGDNILLFTITSRPAQGPPLAWIPEVVSLGVKQPQQEADHSPPSTLAMKHCKSIISVIHTPDV